MEFQQNLDSVRNFFWDVFKIVITSLIIIIPIRYFVVQPFFVRGASMEPTYFQSDYLLVDEISYRFSDPERGDVIIFNFPQEESQFFIKRIIGLPGETVVINDGKVSIKKLNSEPSVLEEPYIRNQYTSGDMEVRLERNEYFVLGDNRSASFDSRRWGPLDRDFIVGRVFLRAWPFDKFGLTDSPAYQLQ